MDNKLKPSSSRHRVTNLKVEYLTNPLGIDKQKPVFSWENISETRAWTQSAYRILVSESEQELSEDIGTIWDSGKVLSAESANIEYGGKELKSCKRYFWKVCTWDREDRPSDYSEINYWEMGIINQEEWKAKWIGADFDDEQPMPIFRREFRLEKPIEKARVYICGLGCYELFINGEKAGDYVLDPGWTNYRKSCLYTIYDVTGMLQNGGNALGVMLGNGMFNVAGGRYVYYKRTFGKPRFILQMKVDYRDGSSELIISDENWKMSPGPITFSCIYGGEDYDARKEQEGWCSAHFPQAESWLPAKIMDPPGGKLKLQTNPPLKVMKTFKPISVTQPKPGVYVYDFGQNFSGRIRFAVRGKVGSAVRFIPSELLSKEGLADQRLKISSHYYEYILKGGPTETWNPRFSYFGFRYVQVEGAVPSGMERGGSEEEKPVVEWIEGEMIYPDVEITGQFECSDWLINRIHEIINWAILSNMKSVLTDCPHREKLGWLEQSHLIGPAIMYNYGVHNLYEKIMNDIRESQRENGLVPDIAPEYIVFGFHEGFVDSPEWGSAAVINPWYIYREYGDIRILEENYDIMKRYVDYLTSRSTYNILHHGLGDWLDFGPNPPFSHHTPMPLVATAIYYYDLLVMEKTAKLLGYKEDMEKYGKLAKEVRDAFNREFFDEQVPRYGVGSQAANSFALFLDIVDEEYRQKIADNLERDLRLRNYQITGGDVGHVFIFRALEKYDMYDPVIRMLQNTDNPGYGFQVVKGATTLCENWAGPTPQRPHGSQNHLMLGGVEEWFYSALAGIRRIHGSTGPRQVVIKPSIAQGIEWVKASHKYPYGCVKVEWKSMPDQNRIQIDITIPANMTGEIHIPSSDPGLVTESGIALNKAEGIKIIGNTEKHTIVESGSGSYSFIIETTNNNARNN